MLHYLSCWEQYCGPLRLFRYLTFRCFMATLTAMAIGFWIAPMIINWLKRLKLAQTLRDKSEVRELADLHAGKKNVPTMGGLIIYASVMLSSILWAELNEYVSCALIVYTGLTAIGFWDDYLKVSKKNSRGLPGRWKLIMQAGIVFAVLFILLINPETHLKMSELWIPFSKEPLLVTMPIWFVFIFLFLVVAGSSNAINLTDGIDGLAIGCTITASLVYAIMSYVAGHATIADYLFIGHVPGCGELAVVCLALVGAGMVFLWYNAYPAEVFMGDTGSLALGGLLGSIAFMTQQPFTLVIVGGVFVMEALSVILQVGSYKLRHQKRIFRMAPIHHHFELKGWPETKVVIRFWIISLIFALIGLSTLKLR
ncbi:MAG: phospho-N-acetylmuramoyl-pentapeptide-transferase [Verrucomicrobia bacterium GWC2_42_7]|nr:MAG: phospho-N-acetylmuramoyl-pentapeptide-transferase [Verrucomicrobia bacterium GWC2_42_7]